MTPDSAEIVIPKLATKYGSFLDLFSQEIIKIGSVSDKDYPEYLRHFITDFNMRQAYAAINKEFSDISELQNGITDAFKHYKYYFPNAKLPKVYTFFRALTKQP